MQTVLYLVLIFGLILFVATIIVALKGLNNKLTSDLSKPSDIPSQKTGGLNTGSSFASNEVQHINTESENMTQQTVNLKSIKTDSVLIQPAFQRRNFQTDFYRPRSRNNVRTRPSSEKILGSKFSPVFQTLGKTHGIKRWKIVNSNGVVLAVADTSTVFESYGIPELKSPPAYVVVEPTAKAKVPQVESRNVEARVYGLPGKPSDQSDR